MTDGGPGESDPAADARAAMVTRQLRSRGIADERAEIEDEDEDEDEEE